MTSFSILLFFVTLASNITLTHLVLSPSKKTITTMLAWSISTVTLILLMQLIRALSIYTPFTATVVGMGFLLTCFYLFNNNYIQIVFTYFSIWLQSAMVSTFYAYLVSLVMYTTPIWTQHLIQIILCIISNIAIYVLVKINLTPIKNLLSLFSHRTLVFLVFPLSSLSLFNALFRSSLLPLSIVTLIKMLIFITIIFSAYYLLFTTIALLLEKSQIDAQFKSACILHDQQIAYFHSLNVHLDEIRKLQHDHCHHLISIHYMTQMNDVPSITAYLDSLISKTNVLDLPKWCSNSPVNALLAYYVTQIDTLGIRKEIEVCLPETLNIDCVDLNVVLGNCLENAIEACIKIPENHRFICLKMSIVNQHLLIHIVNSFNGILNEKNSQLHSTKADFKSHGIGFKSMESIVTRYNGFLNRTHTDHEFSLSIMLHHG